MHLIAASQHISIWGPSLHGGEATCHVCIGTNKEIKVYADL